MRALSLECPNFCGGGLLEIRFHLRDSSGVEAVACNEPVLPALQASILVGQPTGVRVLPLDFFESPQDRVTALVRKCVTQPPQSGYS